MQIQAKVYEEWVEVMRDYSTVFCLNSNMDDGASSISSKGRGNNRQRANIADSGNGIENGDNDDSNDTRTAIEKSGDVSCNYLDTLDALYSTLIVVPFYHVGL